MVPGGPRSSAATGPRRNEIGCGQALPALTETFFGAGVCFLPLKIQFKIANSASAFVGGGQLREDGSSPIRKVGVFIKNEVACYSRRPR